MEEKSYNITSVCKEDLRGYFKDEEIAKLTDSDMQWVASKMADNYLEFGGFWESMQEAVRIILDKREF